MSVTAASFEQVGNEHASGVPTSGDSAGAMSHACRGHAEPDAEHEPVRRHAHASVEHGTQKQDRSVLNEVADEDALRMRSQGMSYRQIGERLGVTTTMAHRRVKRQVVRQNTILNEKLEDARDIELEKLRLMEQALMADAIGGDHSAIKLVLRIMDMRRKYLKDIPLEHAEPTPWFDDSVRLVNGDVGGEEEEGVEESEGQRVEGEEEEEEEEHRTSNKEQGMSKEREEESDDISPEEEAWLLYGPERCRRDGVAYQAPGEPVTYPEQPKAQPSEREEIARAVAATGRTQAASGAQAVSGTQAVCKPAVVESQSGDKSPHSKAGDPADDVYVDAETAQAVLADVFQRFASDMTQRHATQRVAANGEG